MLWDVNTDRINSIESSLKENELRGVNKRRRWYSGDSQSPVRKIAGSVPVSRNSIIMMSYLPVYTIMILRTV